MKSVFATAIFVSILTSHVTAASSNCNDCAYSNAASAFCPDFRTTVTKEFPSPDRLKKIVVQLKPSTAPNVFLGISHYQYPVDFLGWPCPEFQWSSDSKVFFITYSDGGNVGNYHVMLNYPSEKGIKEADPTTFVRKDFLSRYPKCFDPEEPNLAGITWLKESHRLVVAAQVLPHSNCDRMGTFDAYEIEVPSGKIVKRYGQLEAKRNFWRVLGPELRNADDNCFTKPGSCDIPMLHEK